VDFESKKGELTDYFDPKKTWFSLQDVMELTLLHAQQMEAMNEDYTKQIDELNKQLADAKAKEVKVPIDIPGEKVDDSKEREALLNKKIAELQKIIHKKDVELKMIQEENDYYRELNDQQERAPSSEKPTRPIIQNIEVKNNKKNFFHFYISCLNFFFNYIY